MNIIAIMGPHGVFYKDEPIKELESALVAQGFQIIWPQNSVDLLKFIEHNPRICGVIFDWDEYSLDLCSDINQLNEYLPLYAFINTHSTMDVSVQDMRMALWFFEYALGQAEDIAIRMRQYTDEYLDNITPPFTKALFTYVKERKYTFCTPGHMGGTAYQKSPVGCLFYDFFGGNTLKADVSISVTELGSLLDHTGPHLEAEEYIARTFGAEQSYIVTNGTSTSNKIVGMYAAPSGSRLARWVPRLLPDGRRLRPTEVVREYEKTLIDELNLLRESANAIQLRRNFEDSPMLYIPEVYPDYCKPNRWHASTMSGTTLCGV